MTVEARRAAALKEAARLEQKYGHRAGDTGAADYKLNVVPTGVLALDYALGIGGWPKGHPVLLFGPPDIGKSSSLGLAAIRSAQAQGDLCGIIALEPGWDKSWAYRHGVDPEGVVIARPDTGEDAFAILLEWLHDDLLDFILFDSIGAIVSEVEREEGAKSRVGGQAKLVTDGIKRSLMPCWKNNKGLIFLNQIRDDMKARIPGMVKPPGGHAQEHSSAIIVQLKPGKDRYTAKIEGEDVLIGRTVVAVVKRNKMAEGTNQKAQFDFYQKEIAGEPFGIDVAADVIATGLKTGVIRKGGAWYYHDTFPDGKLQGKAGVAEFLTDRPEAIEAVRQGVLLKMFEEQARLKEESGAKQ